MQDEIVSQEINPQGIKGDALDLIKKLMKKNPDERLGAFKGIDEIKSHVFFKDINWSNVLKKKYKYEKQDLKIDLLNTNFNIDTKDLKEGTEIGIDIEEECRVDLNLAPIENDKISLIEIKKRSNSYCQKSFGFEKFD